MVNAPDRFDESDTLSNDWVLLRSKIVELKPPSATARQKTRIGSKSVEPPFTDASGEVMVRSSLVLALQASLPVTRFAPGTAGEYEPTVEC